MARAETVVKAFGRVVRDLRKQYGLSQKELAQRAGMSAEYLGNVELGKCTPSLRAIYALARGFEMRLCVEAPLGRGEDVQDGGQPPPTLDLRTWQRILAEVKVISDYAARMIAHAESRHARCGRAAHDTEHTLKKSGTRTMIDRAHVTTTTRPDQERLLAVYWTLALEENTARAEL
ncbi:MAG: helix-turn-helix transcriptional regulator [Vicinamibacteraceae bacterium]